MSPAAQALRQQRTELKARWERQEETSVIWHFHGSLWKWQDNIKADLNEEVFVYALILTGSDLITAVFSVAGHSGRAV